VKKKLSILIALVMAITLCLTPMVAVAATVLPYAQTFGPSVGGTSVIALPDAPNTVDVVVADTGDGWLQWTYTYPDTPTHTPKMTVAIDYPNGFAITTLDDSSGGWWYAPDPDVVTNRVQFSTDYAGGTYGDWVATTADGSVLTVRIRKSELGLTFKWHGYANVNGNQVWIETVDWAPQGEITIDADLGPSLIGFVEPIIAINVYPTSIDFGTITPGTPVDGDTITVTNIGTVSVTVSAEIDPIGGAFEYLFLNDVQRANGIWNAAPLGMGLILPTEDADCTTGLQVPVTYSAKGVENTTLIFITSPATP